MLNFYRSALFLVCTLLAWGWFARLMRVDRHHRFRWFWWALLPLGVVFYVLDVAFNWIVGSLIWFELPREFTYTARLKDIRFRRDLATLELVNNPTNEVALRVMRKTEGIEWQASILNGIDPGHV